MIGSQNIIKLRITGPDGSTTESRSERESVVIGSGAAAEVQLADAAVSSLHLMLKWDKDGGVTAIDLGSERGTRLGDQPLRAPVPVSSGDVLALGETRLQVLFGKELEEVPAPASTMGSEALPFSRPLPLNQIPTEQSRVLQVAMLWGDTVIDVQHFADGVPVTIGESKRNCFQVFSPLVGGSYRLAVANGSSIAASVPSGARAEVSSAKGKQTNRELEGRPAGTASLKNERVRAQLHDRLHISLGQVSFLLRFVRPLPGVKIQVLEETDVGFLRIAALCAMACILLIIGLVIDSKPRSTSDGALLQTPAHYARFFIKPEVKKKAAKKEDIGLPEGAKAKEEEGKFGLKNAKKEEADPSRPGSPILDPRKNEDERKKVMTAGLLGAWGKTPDASNVLGPGGFGTGINDALGGLKAGAGLVDAKGIGGLGSRGSGVGGGGTALGLGGLGTRGDGRGIGGSGSLDLAGRGKETTRVVPGKTIVVGGLSKEVIAKIIRSHQSEIKYCYEVELQKNPSLFGKVAVLFIIDASGTVSDANVAESSLDNSNTEQCMLGRIRRWKFPEPQGGGLVTVTFPWIFKPAGGEES